MTVITNQRWRWEQANQALDESSDRYGLSRINEELFESAHLDKHGVTVAEADEWTPDEKYGDNDPDDYLIRIH